MSGDTKLSCPLLRAEDAIAWAAQNNLIVVLPKPNQLLIDIDDKYDRAQFVVNYDLIDSLLGVESHVETPSRSGKPGKSHIIVNLKTDVTPTERVAWQAILGGDRRACAHSMRRIKLGEENPVLLFETPKYMAGTTVYDTSESQ